MERVGGDARPIDEPRSLDAPRSYASRGAWIGCTIGLLAVWRIMRGVVDPNVKEHSAKFPVAVFMVCAFAVFVWLLLTMIGRTVGSTIVAKADGERRPESDLSSEA